MEREPEGPGLIFWCYVALVWGLLVLSIVSQVGMKQGWW